MVMVSYFLDFSLDNSISVEERSKKKAGRHATFKEPLNFPANVLMSAGVNCRKLNFKQQLVPWANQLVREAYKPKAYIVIVY